MSYQWALAIALHQLGTIVWVGGMFFAHMALRPAANELLDPPQRLPLMLRVFDRFFPWVWVAIGLLWAGGFWIFLGVYGGKVGMYVHAMMGIAAIMTALFGFIWFVPYRRMKAAVARSDWPDAGAHLALIRKVILTNLLLGLVTAVLGAAGPKL
ncbi:MAG: CopD family protein [Pseudomonadota bacterium]|nr:CopD family protein [Pseudomonadota bacterium]